ncbi:MAG: hypothetical protein JJ975_15080 [Bacteroidia bacterium]|nr:hypothetical protein [Bacteroidia bacterium]
MTRLILLFGFFSVFSIAFGQQVTIKGEVEFSFQYANIKAGEDYSLETESKQDGVSMSIRKLKRNSYWAVTVYKSDINWNNKVKIYVRRTNGGSGNGYTWGCTNYTRVRNMPQSIMWGAGGLNNIYLQYRLSGISMDLPANTYYTDIVYTLYEQ